MSIAKQDIFLMDPPWQYAGLGRVLHTKNVTDHYGTMSIPELLQMGPLLKELANPKGSLIFMWTTGPILKQSIELLCDLGWEYRSMAFVWHKQKNGPGYYTMGSTEFVLVGKRGTTPPMAVHNLKQFFSQKRMKHSEKPTYVHEEIERAWPDANKMELFARRHREGWHCLGNELSGLDIREELARCIDMSQRLVEEQR